MLGYTVSAVILALFVLMNLLAIRFVNRAGRKR